MKKTSRSKESRIIKQNRPNWRKKVIGYRTLEIKRGNKYFRKKIKIKGKIYEKVKIKKSQSGISKPQGRGGVNLTPVYS